MSSTSSNCCSSKKRDETKYTEKKREMRNYESYQQAMMLALLNPYCSFSIEHPVKKSKVTTSMPKVLSLHFDTEDIDVIKLAETQCKLILKNEIENGVYAKTALRRYEKNKRVFIQNFIFDVCLEKGFTFDSFLTRKSKKITTN
ncbi:TATA-binding protein-associated phosphoprotein [Entamoeba marina]